MDIKQRKEIKQIYEANMLKIVESYPKFIPYLMDWQFTPIEKNVWYYIRVYGLPLYPQFPISWYFVDFCDPVKKIVIEVDGENYHQDKIADSKRQKEIETMGYTFYRIAGSDTAKLEDYYCNTCGTLLENYNNDTEARGFIARIMREHYSTIANEPTWCGECEREIEQEPEAQAFVLGRD